MTKSESPVDGRSMTDVKDTMSANMPVITGTVKLRMTSRNLEDYLQFPRLFVFIIIISLKKLM